VQFRDPIEPDPHARALDPGSIAYVEAWDQHITPHPSAAAPRSGFRLLRDVLQVVLLAAVLFVGTRTVVQGREVRGPSMQPTYHSGQRLFVTRYFFSAPHRGDVVVFHPPAQGRDDYIKRVIGVPGDHVVVNAGRVWVNGEALSESYLSGAQTTCFGRYCDVTLGDSEYYVLGDNRPNSSDSRFWGPVKRDQIVGRAWLLYYPLSDFGLAQ
jgi:signal peptidase I